jgi:hypothetical protein
MGKVTCSPDADTNCLLGIMAWCLATHFGHTEESATATVERYYKAHAHIHDDDTYHGEGPYWMACRIHYVSDLGGDLGSFPDWQDKNYSREAECDTLEYFNEHYFQRPPVFNWWGGAGR